MAAFGDDWGTDINNMQAGIFFSGAPSGRSRRLLLITRPPASYGANPRQEPGDCKSRDSSAIIYLTQGNLVVIL